MDGENRKYTMIEEEMKNIPVSELPNTHEPQSSAMGTSDVSPERDFNLSDQGSQGERRGNGEDSSGEVTDEGGSEIMNERMIR